MICISESICPQETKGGNATMYAQGLSLSLTGLVIVISSSILLPNNLYGRTWSIVQSGDNGPNVYAVQAMLKQRGYNLTYDGAFGAGTQAVVESFQRANGLTADGIVGPNTWEKLAWTLHLNANNLVVNALQRELVKHGHSVTIDGDFGAGTLAAVKSFQSSKGLSPDGVVGPDTWAALTASATATSRASLARAIINNSRISLATVHSSGVSDNANARQNMLDTANGGAAHRSTYGTAPGGTVFLSTAMLKGMTTLSQSWSFGVSEICGGSHSSNSRHYAGVAFDVSTINGSHVSASHPSQQAFRNKCSALGATEVLGPGDAGHSTHIHAGWPRP
jgi:peptidoglycan hydrolase-like protein with peptidoglycan-binding domain